MTQQRIFQFDRLLVGDHWAEDAKVRVGEDGLIAAVEVNGAGGDGGNEQAEAERLQPGRPVVQDVRGLDASAPTANEQAAAERLQVEHVRGWTIPGVPNVHSHAFQRAMAGLAEASGQDSFWTWRDTMYRFLEKLGPDDVEAIAAQTYVELLKAGFTCVGEFHYLQHAPDGRPYDDPDEMSKRILAAARTAGIGLVHLPAMYDAGGFAGTPLEGAQRRFRLGLDDAVRLHDSLAPAFAEAGAQLGWAVHSLRAVAPASLRRAAEFLEDVAPAPVHVHVAEQQREVEECLAFCGARPVARLLAEAPVDDRWCLVHATHVTSEEAADVVGRGATVGLCPTTEANLGDGLFPLADFAERGGRFAVGTDSHVSRSPVEELRLLEYGQRLVHQRRAVLPFPATARATGRPPSQAALDGAAGPLLAHAWRDGARALDWNGGRIEEGRRADFVVLDAEHPALAGRDGRGVLDSWLFSGMESPVADVYVGGERVVAGGRHVREDRVAGAFRAIARSLAER